MEEDQKSDVEIASIKLMPWDAIFIPPDRMLMGVDCFRDWAIKRKGYIQELSWIDKCAIKGETTLTYYNIRCFASIFFDAFYKEHDGAYHVKQKELDEFIARAVTESQEILDEVEEQEDRLEHKKKQKITKKASGSNCCLVA
ncbi:MAG: hypothetical protein H0W88_04625 [Parachlamydiaceae bacterium]|nr:hypothetical protein [Parachlamydiaceae bacterium]